MEQNQKRSTMEQNQRFAAPRTKTTGRPAGKEQSGDAQCYGVLAEHWHSLERSSREIWPLAKWENVLAQLIQQDIVDETTLMLDSTSMKVHQHASSCKKGAAASQKVAAGED